MASIAERIAAPQAASFDGAPDLYRALAQRVERYPEAPNAKRARRVLRSAAISTGS